MMDFEITNRFVRLFIDGKLHKEVYRSEASAMPYVHWFINAAIETPELMKLKMGA